MCIIKIQLSRWINQLSFNNNKFNNKQKIKSSQSKVFKNLIMKADRKLVIRVFESNMKAKLRISLILNQFCVLKITKTTFHKYKDKNRTIMLTFK